MGYFDFVCLGLDSDLQLKAVLFSFQEMSNNNHRLLVLKVNKLVDSFKGEICICFQLKCSERKASTCKCKEISTITHLNTTLYHKRCEFLSL